MENMKALKTGMLSFAAVVACGSLSAQTLFEYKFDDNSTVYDPSGIASNLTVGDFTPGPGTAAANIDSTSAVAESGRALFVSNAGFNQLDEAGAIGGDDYVSFEVTVDAGFQVDFTSLDFFTLRRENVDATDEGLGAPSAFSVYSSADGFTNQIGSGTLPLVDFSVDNTNPFEAQSVSLSSLQDVTGTTEFRIIFWAGDGIASPGERTWRLDELSVSGTTEVPEPSTYAAIFGLLALGYAWARRRRS